MQAKKAGAPVDRDQPPRDLLDRLSASTSAAPQRCRTRFRTPVLSLTRSVPAASRLTQAVLPSRLGSRRRGAASSPRGRAPGSYHHGKRPIWQRGDIAACSRHQNSQLRRPTKDDHSQFDGLLHEVQGPARNQGFPADHDEEWPTCYSRILPEVRHEDLQDRCCQVGLGKPTARP